MDKIFIKDLRVRCILGINPEERENRQDILINIVLYADLKKACASDNIEDTVNYKNIKKDLLRMTEDSNFYLIEGLGESIAKTCLSYSGVEKVKVHIDKPGALRFARSVAVEITRLSSDE